MSNELVWPSDIVIGPIPVLGTALTAGLVLTAWPQATADVGCGHGNDRQDEQSLDIHTASLHNFSWSLA
jgi:hypothetical protein